MGEEISCKYLKGIDYKIICRNFRTNFGEIDIIAKYKNEIIFIEVKTRLSKKFGYPAEAVDYNKQKKIVGTSKYYLKINRLEQEKIRYDIIEVYMKDKKIFINHIRNVFF